MGSSDAVGGELFDAVRANDLPALEAALSEGADVNQSDLSGTALHLAAATGAVEMAEALIAAGADLEAAGEPAGAQPLHVAAQVNEPAIVRLLIERGVDVDARDGEGRTPLMVAAVNGSEDSAAVLLEAGADPRAEDAIYHDAPIHFASWSSWTGVLDLLLSSGIDVNLQNPESGQSPLHYAARHGKPETIELLIANGADPDLRNRAGQTPAQAAMSPETVELLRKLGAE